LDVGVGSGYLAAVMARMNPSATVYGIDVKEPLIFQAHNNFLQQVSES
jgi:protein-L-isoaspartate O-methyltransferase